MTHEVSKRWRINYEIHLIRNADYKGGKIDMSKMPVKLPFNGCTFPGFIFVATCLKTLMQRLVDRQPNPCVTAEVASVLQIRSCRPEHQKAALTAMELFIGNAAPPDMDIPLLPNVEVCILSASSSWVAYKHDIHCLTRGKIKCIGHNVCNESWEKCLRFLQLLVRLSKHTFILGDMLLM